VKRVTCFVCCVILMTTLVACTINWGAIINYYPEEGVWYCKELGLQVSFDEKGETYILADGKKMACSFMFNGASKKFIIMCAQIDCADHQLGEAVLRGEHYSYDEEVLKIKEVNTGIIYDFVRIE